MDYRLIVLSDKCLDRKEEVRRVLVEDVFKMQTRVLSSEAWMKEISRTI